MQNEVTEIEHFNTIHKKYDLQYGYKDKFVRYKIVQRVKGLKKEIPQSKANILEIGCGTGEYTKLLAINFPKSKIYAFDISKEMIKEAKKKCKGMTNVRFFVDNAYKTKIKMKFDFIVGFYVFHHLNLPEVMKEVSSLLISGGRLMMFEPNILNPIVFLIKKTKILKRIVGDSPTESAINPLTIDKTMKGLHLLSISTHEFLPPLPFFPYNAKIVLNNIASTIGKIPPISFIGGTVEIIAMKNR